MKNIYNKVSSSTSICYFYILLLITSLFIKGDTHLLRLFTLTTTITSIYILLDFKSKLNSKLNLHSLDMFFYTFVIIKIILSLLHISGVEYMDVVGAGGFRSTLAFIQLIYAAKLISCKTRIVKGLPLYGFAIGASSLFMMFSGGYEVSFALSLFNTYILSEVFREFEELSSRYV